MRLLLHKLTKLLEVRVAAEELKATEGLATSGTGTGTGTSATSTAATFTCLSSGFEKVEGLIATRRSSGSSAGGGRLGGLSLLLLLFLDVIGNTLWP